MIGLHFLRFATFNQLGRLRVDSIDSLTSFAASGDIQYVPRN